MVLGDFLLLLQQRVITFLAGTKGESSVNQSPKELWVLSSALLFAFALLASGLGIVGSLRKIANCNNTYTVQQRLIVKLIKRKVSWVLTAHLKLQL